VDEGGARGGVTPAQREGARGDALRAMLEPRSVAIVGATSRQEALGYRALVEVERSPSVVELHLVNPTRAGERIGGREVVASLDDVPGPVDCVLFAVGDEHLDAAVAAAARRGDRGGVVFGNAVGPPGEVPSLRDRIACHARDAGMALCGGGCMGFVSRSVRAIGYLEPVPVPPGPVALVTHSGSVFSALLRADRPFGWSVAVSSGQELVTTTADYLDYALGLEETGVLALVLETLRDAPRLRAALDRARAAGVPVVALTVGTSPAGEAMVAAHSGALAGGDGVWEALCDRHGVLRVRDLEELCDTVELLVAGRRPPRRPAQAGRGIAAVLDSGAERALLVDVADACDVPFARIGDATRGTLLALLDPGLEPTNPLDVWGRGRATEELFTETLVALADDDAVDAVALAIDFVPEFDGDESYRTAALAAWQRTTKPLCVLSHVPSALDRPGAHKLRAAGVPVLEGTRSGLLALGHLLELADHEARAGAGRPAPRPADESRQARWRARLEQSVRDGGPAAGPGHDEAVALLADYGVASLPFASVATRDEALEAARRLGYPVALKTAAPGIAHKTDAGGVRLGLTDASALGPAYDELAGRLGPQATVSPMAPDGVDLTVGFVRDPLVGPLVVVGAGGTLVDLLDDRAVALPPLTEEEARRILGRLRVARLLAGYRDLPPADLEAVVRSVVAMAAAAAELGDAVRAVEVNPLRCTATGAVALDVLVEP
jgi:acyl-CoA synthetase (NDP forming)